MRWWWFAISLAVGLPGAWRSFPTSSSWLRPTCPWLRSYGGVAWPASLASTPAPCHRIQRWVGCGKTEACKFDGTDPAGGRWLPRCHCGRGNLSQPVWQVRLDKQKRSTEWVTLTHTWFSHIDTSMANILFSKDSRGMGFPTGSSKDQRPVTPIFNGFKYYLQKNEKNLKSRLNPT